MAVSQSKRARSWTLWAVKGVRCTAAPGNRGVRRLVQVETGDCPHTLFYGSTGAGKKTLIAGLLRQIFGPSVERLKVCAIGAQNVL